MRLQKIFLIHSAVFILIILTINAGFSQVKKEEVISFPGIIEMVDKDFKFIVVNEARMFISSNTRVMDKKGNILKIIDLKPNLYITIEVLRNQDGLFVKKIVIETPKGKP